MLEEPLVFGGKNGIDKNSGRLLGANHTSTFFPKLANSNAVGCHNAQWHLGAVVCQCFDLGKARACKRDNQQDAGNSCHKEQGEDCKCLGDFLRHALIIAC